MTHRGGKGVAIMGATATGKSRLAIELAREFDGEIVSMDSRQVYRGLDIGTAKDPAGARGGIPHHLLDIIEPNETYSAGRHLAKVHAVMDEVEERGALPFLVGGTGLYFRVLFGGMIDVRIPREEQHRIRSGFADVSTSELYAELEKRDPDRALELSRNDRRRICRALEIYQWTGEPYTRHAARQTPARPWSGVKIVVTLPRPQLHRRIAERTRAMFAAGWIDEVRQLLQAGVAVDAPAMNSLGYGLIARALQSDYNLDDLIEQVIVQTRQYAKRQETFFRSVDGAVWRDTTTPQAIAEVRDRIRNAL